MKNTKAAFLTFILAAAVTLSACGNKNSGSSGETSAATTTTVATTAATEAAEADNDVDIAPPALENPDDGGERAPIVSLADDSNPLKPLVEAAVSAGGWADLMEETDKDLIKNFFCVDLDALAPEQSVFLQCPMSANMTELHIIKSSDVNAAKKALEERKEKAQSMDAFYPDDVEKAESSIVGTEGDYAYFIMSSDSQAAENALVKAIKAQ